MPKPQQVKTLKERGFRMTPVRSSMLELFGKQHEPISAEAICTHQPDAHKTTIYRELAFFEEQGLIRKIDFGDGIRRYELAEREHHHHLICVSCKKITDIRLKHDLEIQERTISRRTGFKILNHALEFFGLCPSCK
jgi:Fe2+ or Zn2+ uptake regulation protein